MPDSRRDAQFRQTQHALVLGQLVTFTLLGRQFQLIIVNYFRRQIGEHLVLCPPQNIVAYRAAHFPRLHLRQEKSRGKKLEYAHQVVGAVFHGRAGQGPTPLPRNRTHNLARRACAILYPLRFVQQHQIEIHRCAGYLSL